jgi:NitT/TauT family transport system ATP-binding protein
VDAIRLTQVGKRFQGRGRSDGFHALDGVDLAVAEGEFFCLLGPTGCGKSTVLHLVAGFEKPSEGRIEVFGDEVDAPAADRGVVFQTELALFPWLTVAENVAFGLDMRGVARAERARVLDRNLELVGLAAHRAKFPRELSGGMKQRVQIARALANDPRILLMDEPFGALDAQTRRHLQGELVRIWGETRKTVVFVTHDIGEAIWLADRVGVMTRGPAARVREIVTVDLPRPRHTMTDGFVRLFNDLSRIIEAEAQAMLDG